jgi:hypothetical protein
MDFSSLAAEQKIIVVILTLVVGGGYTIIRFMRPLLDSVTAKPNNTATDTVVISGAFADAAPVRQLTEQIKKMDESNDRVVAINERLCLALEAQSRASIAVAESANRKIESEMRLTAETRMLCEEMARHARRQA